VQHKEVLRTKRKKAIHFFQGSGCTGRETKKGGLRKDHKNVEPKHLMITRKNQYSKKRWNTFKSVECKGEEIWVSREEQSQKGYYPEGPLPAKKAGKNGGRSGGRGSSEGTIPRAQKRLLANEKIGGSKKNSPKKKKKKRGGDETMETENRNYLSSEKKHTGPF